MGLRRLTVLAVAGLLTSPVLLAMIGISWLLP